MSAEARRWSSLTRRRVLGAVGASVGGSLLGPLLAPRREGLFAAPTAGVRLGVASYSLRKLSRAGAISAIAELDCRWVNIKSVHLPYESSAGEVAKARAEFAAAGLEIVGGGTIYLQKKDPDDIRRHFEYARRCGMPLMVIAPTVETVPLVERFVREYDIKVAIHNHGPEDEHFPSPYDVLEAVAGLDPRVGLCIDLGHTARTGVDLVKAVEDAGGRLLDMHMKDLRDLRAKDSQCIVGEGAMPVADVFRQLARQGYQGYVNLEYEIDADDPLPGMKQSFAYMRGVLDGLASGAARAD